MLTLLLKLRAPFTRLIWTPKEKRLLYALALLFALGFFGHAMFPLTPDAVHALMLNLGVHHHSGAQGFADTRALFSLPNAADVLSNLPFLAFGVWGLLRLRARRHGQAAAMTAFFIGLVCTALGSMWYHLAPSDATLLWDRAGMGLAFAGVMGLAAGQAGSVRVGLVTLWAALIGAALALGVWHSTQDVLPWSVVQFGGMVLILSCAFAQPAFPQPAFAQLKPSADAPIKLLALIGFYALAKAFESMDLAIYQATGYVVSGHSLKHIAASLAAIPVLASLNQGRRRQG